MLARDAERLAEPARAGREQARIVEAGVVASLTSLRFSIASGGLLCVIGTVVVAFAVPAFTRYDARAPG